MPYIVDAASEGGVGVFAQTFVVANQKGGSQKTSTVVNLAAELGARGYRVLVLDYDPQGSSTYWLGHGKDEEGLWRALADSGKGLADLVRSPTTAEGVDLVPADTWLSHAERLMAGEIGAQLVLKKKLAELSGWDFIFIDTPPTLGFLTVSALVAARNLVIPVEVSGMALGGLGDLLATIDKAHQTLNPELLVTGVILHRFDSRTIVTREVRTLVLKYLSDKLFETPIRENVRMRTAWSAQEPIRVHDPSCLAARDYVELADEFLARVDKMVAA